MGVHFKENEEKITMGMIISGIVIIGILMASLIVYMLNVNNSKTEGDSEILQGQFGEVKEENDDDFESVSIDIGKTVNEATNELNGNTASKNENTAAQTSSKNTTNTVGNNTTQNTTTQNTTNTVETNANTTSNEVEADKKNEEVKFEAPVKGEIIREFAPDSLVYSETLEEWVTHNGVDIKADKTSVVKAAASGTVFAIKNDPRYGLTVIVNHAGGYKTVYSNLLTAEFVVEGEEIEAGQTIGTVGNTATFEFLDDYHLHFELMKDGEYVNPGSCMEF